MRRSVLRYVTKQLEEPNAAKNKKDKSDLTFTDL